MQIKEIPYWMALAHFLPGWKASKVNALVDRAICEERITLEDFFHLEETKWKNIFGLTTPDVIALVKAKLELTRLAFLAENLLNGGYEILSMYSPGYPPALRKHLGAAHTPAIIYIKGNPALLQKNAVAIVGSRRASPVALNFTENIVRSSVKEAKVVISGYARGVDKKALESAIECGGQSTIVLGQGILTFTFGFKAYYKHIVAGNVLILSSVPPEESWQIGSAMARNPIIYGMADDIYVAESSENGGTWSGVMAGFRKKRTIYVRQADGGENNANNLLIQKGGIAVDVNGNRVASSSDSSSEQISMFDITDLW